MEIRSYRDLVAWQKAMDLVGEIYRASQNFPKEEIFGLTSQIRRAAVSIPSNIAEGHQRLSRKEYQYFLSNARGSLAEIETQMLISRRLSYLGEDDLNHLVKLTGEVGKILNGLLNSLKQDRSKD